MGILKIVPSASNSCQIEVYEYKGQEKGYVLSGVLELSEWTLGGCSHLSILRREKEFAKFNVFNEEGGSSKLLASTHSVDIEFPK